MLIRGHCSGRLTSAQRFTIMAHDIICAVRGSILCIRSASPAIAVCRHLRQLAVSRGLYREFRPDSLPTHSRLILLVKSNMPRQAVLHRTFGGREIAYVLLVTRTFLALEMVLHDFTSRVTTSLTSVGNSAGSPEPIVRPSLATGHDAEILDLYDPHVGYDADTCPYQPLTNDAMHISRRAVGRVMWQHGHRLGLFTQLPPRVYSRDYTLGTHARATWRV
jgi:hypothetical protein